MAFILELALLFFSLTWFMQTLHKYQYHFIAPLLLVKLFDGDLWGRV